MRSLTLFLVFLGVSLVGWSTKVMAGSSGPKVIFRLHLETDDVSATDKLSRQVRLTNPDQMIYIKSYPEVSEKDIIAVKEQIGAEGLGALIKFGHAGKVSLQTATAGSLGKILLVFLNGRAVYAPRIDSEITSGELFIPRGIFPQEIEQIKNQIKQNKKN